LPDQFHYLYLSDDIYLDVKYISMTATVKDDSVAAVSSITVNDSISQGLNQLVKFSIPKDVLKL
jgi:hypothetical protein